MNLELPSSWEKILSDELRREYMTQLTHTLSTLYQDHIVFPPKDAMFRALELSSFAATRVVILGQDPYHGHGQAHGLSFSVKDGVKIPPSLKNIYKELQTDIGKPIPTSGNLEPWARQGVLLLNSILTVEANKPGSHQELGWQTFTDAIIKKISDEKEHVVFLLWGNFARAKKNLIDSRKHLVLEAPHPSPFSAHTGFFGSRHFSQTNSYLAKHDIDTVDW